MSDRMNIDQNKVKENGTEERLDGNDKGRSKSALEDLSEYMNSTTNHLKLYERHVAKLLANVSHEFEQTTVKQEQITKLSRLLKESDRERTRYRKERDDLRKQFHEGKKLITEKEIELRREMEELKQKTEQTEKEWAKRLKESEETSDAIINDQIQKNAQTAEDLKTRELKIKSLEEKIEMPKLVSTDLDLERKISDYKRQLNETNDKLQRALSKLNFTEKELEEIKSRLSKAIGDKLTNNNPNIANLSDQNRPTKLAEKFAELYDNQWTDAYEEIERYLSVEDDVIRILFEILMDVMRFCEQRAQRQMDKLQSELSCCDNPTEDRVPDNIMKQLKDLRKMLASAAKDSLYQLYISILKRSTDENRIYAMKVEPFVKECFEICWFMAIQDPPMVLRASDKSGESLNTDVFKPYTSSGRYIQFLVWPAMLLHESGPVLAKGIAQGTNDIKVSQAWVDDEVISDRNICDYRSLSRTSREESRPYGESDEVLHIRDNRYLSSGEDRHHHRSKSAEATRPSYKHSIVGSSYKQSTVVTTGLGTKPTVHVRRHLHERHPTPEEMRRYFYYLNRRDYSGAQNALGYDIYMKCMHNEHKRSQYR